MAVMLVGSRSHVTLHKLAPYRANLIYYEKECAISLCTFCMGFDGQTIYNLTEYKHNTQFERKFSIKIVFRSERYFMQSVSSSAIFLESFSILMSFKSIAAVESVLGLSDLKLTQTQSS